MSAGRRTIPRTPPPAATPIFGRPDGEIPDLPVELTSMSAAVEMSNAEVGEATADANVRFTEAQAMVRGWGEKDKVTVAKAEMSSDPEVAKARDAALGAYARRKMTQVIYANCERCVFVISRELSRRIGNVGFERRNNRWNP
jgi:cell division ATPase FtsA